MSDYAIQLQWAEIAILIVVPFVGFICGLLFKLQRRVSDLDIAVGILQSRLDSSPSAEAMSSLAVEVAQMRGSIDATGKLIAAHAAQLQRIEEHLLGGGK